MKFFSTYNDSTFYFAIICMEINLFSFSTISSNSFIFTSKQENRNYNKKHQPDINEYQTDANRIENHIVQFPTQGKLSVSIIFYMQSNVWLIFGVVFKLWWSLPFIMPLICIEINIFSLSTISSGSFIISSKLENKNYK